MTALCCATWDCQTPPSEFEHIDIPILTPAEIEAETSKSANGHPARHVMAALRPGRGCCDSATSRTVAGTCWALVGFFVTAFGTEAHFFTDRRARFRCPLSEFSPSSPGGAHRWRGQEQRRVEVD